MKKSVIFLVFAMLTAFLSGCILSKTPNTRNVTMNLGEQKTFSVNVLPSGGDFIWSLDGVPLLNSTKSYVYTAEAGEHILIVQATHIFSTDITAWNIYGNSPPVAEAGLDQTVVLDANITLNGSGSTDPDDNIVSYRWEQIDGPTAALTNADKAIAHFIASVASGSTLSFKFTVTDAGGLQATDTCVIRILSAPIIGLLSSMVSIPGGTFMMGSNVYSDEQPIHSVTLQGFEIGKYEVTQAQYIAIMGNNPSYFQEVNGYLDTENNPVENVTWYEAGEFCMVLSAQTGRTFKLPSEAQWEYACRAGTTTLYSFGDDAGQLGDYAWYVTNSNGTTHPVGTKLPNAWGLYDMHGNNWEWCQDHYHSSYIGAPTDGSAWESETGYIRVLRGGSWGYDAARARSAYHGSSGSPGVRHPIRGFRVVAIP